MALKILKCFICRCSVNGENRSFNVFSHIVFLAKTRTYKPLKNSKQMCLGFILSRPANLERTSPRQSLCMDGKFQSSLFSHICHLIYKFSLFNNASTCISLEVVELN